MALVLLLTSLAPAADVQAAVPTPRPAPSGSGGSSGGSSAGSSLPAPAPAPAAPASTGSSKSVISGSVLLDEDGDRSASRGDRPLVGVAVRIIGPGADHTATTNGGGAFSLGGLPSGAFSVTVALPAGVVPIGGNARTVVVDGKSSARADFFVARAGQPPAAAAMPTPTPAPQPTATVVPTATVRALPTPVVAPGAPPAVASSRGEAPVSSGRTSPGSASRGPAPGPLVSSATRYYPGRTAPSDLRVVRTDNAVWLGVPFVSQLDGSAYGAVNCGPASVSMVLGAFGIRVGPASIRDYVNAVSGVYGLGAGTSLDHLGRLVRESGLEVSGLYGPAGGYQRWSTQLLREQVLAGRPVVTLVKYRALPSHGGSVTEFDHYIVIAGVAGDDFIYNDAIYTGTAGHGLLISPRDLERAWDYSSIPRHGMAVGLGAARAQPAESTEPELDLGDELSDEALLAANLELADDLPFGGEVSGLSFKRVLIDGPTEADALIDGGLELAAFLDPGLRRASLELAADVVAYQGQPLPLREVVPTPRPIAPSPPFMLPLALLTAGLMVVFFAVTARRALE